MSTYKGNLEISVFGESHGEYIGITIHNFPSNINLNIEKIKSDLKKRSSFTISKSKRTEPDEFNIISGYFNNLTTGAPLTFLIKNKDVNSNVYLDNLGKIRPSHGDYTSFVKYKGANDFRGGGHLSGRLTSLFVILGSICENELLKHNIKITSCIKSIYNIESDTYNIDNLDESFPVCDPIKKEEMITFLSNLHNDSVGGVVETFVNGAPIGLGNPIFDSVESVISHLMFSIPAIKGIEFGSGFDITKSKGSLVNDQIEYDNGNVRFLSNNSGGIQGGISNGEVINFRCAIKPTPSIAIPLKSINVFTKENLIVQTTGRHDACIVPKVVHVINAMTQFAIYDLLLGEKNG